jgi:Iron-containing redox enzyme
MSDLENTVDANFDQILNANAFCECVSLYAKKFETVPILARLENRLFDVNDYHRYLLAVFHQVVNGSGSLALAAAKMPVSEWSLKSYLFKHADEEKYHWRWILSDLRKSGYSGIDPFSLKPYWPVEAYIAYNYFVADNFPYGRLAIAFMLEQTSALFATKFAGLVGGCLGFGLENVRFLSRHGEIDSSHAGELKQLILDSDLSSDVLKSMARHAHVASFLYRSIFINLYS